LLASPDGLRVQGFFAGPASAPKPNLAQSWLNIAKSFDSLAPIGSAVASQHTGSQARARFGSSMHDGRLPD
jgi:hypothetical protein